MPIPKAASWVVRKILDCRTPLLDNQQLQGDLLLRPYGLCMLGKFHIQKLYHVMLPIFPKVERKNLLLTSNVLPRHKFIAWLAAQRQLPTVDRLQKIGVHVSVNCVFCNQHVEESAHLFFECPVTNRLWFRICCWLGHNRTIGSWETELQWICYQARNKLWHKAVAASVFVITVALIWRNMNYNRFEGKALEENQFCREIALLIHIRGRNCKRWQAGLRQLNQYP